MAVNKEHRLLSARHRKLVPRCGKCHTFGAHCVENLWGNGDVKVKFTL